MASLSTTPADPAAAIRAARRGFTLIEMTVVVVLIGMLASMMLAGLGVARQRARVARTKTTIRKIHEIIVPRYESYLRRRVPFDMTANARTNAVNRLTAIRERMVYEMPDSWGDVAFKGTSAAIAVHMAEIPLRCRNATTMAYASYLNGIYEDANRDGTLQTEDTNGNNKFDVEWDSDFSGTFDNDEDDWIVNGVIDTEDSNGNRVLDTEDRNLNGIFPEPIAGGNGSAECLYMIVSRSGLETDLLQQFHSSEIGDVDRDGAPEFLDGWARPIVFLRWAPGFSCSPGTPGVRLPPLTPIGSGFSLVQFVDPVSSHDPFDPQRVDPAGYALMPLIVSGGPDGLTGLQVTAAGWRSLNLASIVTSGSNIGAPVTDSDHLDNITNHDLSVK